MNIFFLPLIKLIIVVFSIVLHETAHGAIAYAMGDPTAKLAGRITLNPIKHLDPIGSLIVPLIGVMTMGFPVGWAKPVPVNPYNFRDQKYGEAKSAFAGPAANLVTALFFGLIMRFLPIANNSILTGFYVLLGWIVILNLGLAIFNLMPLPPLDGSHILFAFLPLPFQKYKYIIYQYSLFLLILFILYGFRFVVPIMLWCFQAIVGDFSWFSLSQ